MPFENKLREILSAGGLAFGCCSHIPSTGMVEIMGLAGFDFVMLDTEHGLYTIDTAGELIRASQGAGATPLVRVTSNDKSLILKALDMGAQGVVVPHISTKDDAARAVESSRYGPHGRGACPLVRANGYGLWDWREHEDRANKNVMVIVLIEDLEGMRNIEDILSVDGVDAVYTGAFDMSVSAGHKGNTAHEQVQQALDRIMSACRERDMPVMHSLLNGHDVKAWAEKGVRLFMQSADSFIYAKACREFLDSVSHLRGRTHQD